MISPSNSLLSVRNLSVHFSGRHGTLTIVDNLSYDLAAGKTLAIIGESGSGKSMSVRALMRLLPDMARVTGTVSLKGTDLIALSSSEMRTRRGSELAMIFQDASRALNPTMRVGDQIVEAIRHNSVLDNNEARRRAFELLDMLRFPSVRQKFHCFPHELSGGLKQRVSIAIGISGNPSVLIADEATRALDAIVQSETLQLLKALQVQFGMALILISHDLRLAERVADNVLVMYSGRAVEYASTTHIFGNPRMPYTKALLDAIPHPHSPPHTIFPVVHGHPPNLSALPRGCSFQSRCSFVDDDCRAERPAFIGNESGHHWACLHPRGTAEERR